MQENVIYPIPSPLELVAAFVLIEDSEDIEANEGINSRSCMIEVHLRLSVTITQRLSG